MSAPHSSRAPGTTPGSLRIGSIAGTDVYVSSSWFIVAGLIAVLLAPRVEQVQPGLGAGKYLAGLAFAVVLYGSVLLHEASHAVMAKRYGYRVTSISLNFLGGMTAVDGEARTPRHELMIAIVGPLTSLAVGGAAVGLWFVTPEGLLLMAIEGLAGANLLVGVINLVPGLPLDGGRVLKATVWGASGDVHRGTIAAGWGGRAAAVLVLGWPWAQAQIFGVGPELLDFALSFVVALFLWTGANAAIVSARIRRRLPGLVARQLARRAVTVPGDLPLAEAVRRAQETQAGGIVTLDQAGAPVGIVNETALLAIPEERRPWVPVSAVTRSATGELTLAAGLAGEELIRAISRRPASEYLLVEPDGRLFGVLSTADVDRAFREGNGEAPGGRGGARS